MINPVDRTSQANFKPEKTVEDAINNLKSKFKIVDFMGDPNIKLIQMIGTVNQQFYNNLMNDLQTISSSAPPLGLDAALICADLSPLPLANPTAAQLSTFIQSITGCEITEKDSIPYYLAQILSA